MYSIKYRFFFTFFVLTLLVSCLGVSSRSPEPLNLGDISAKELEAIEASGDITRWFNALVAAQRKGLTDNNVTEASRLRLLSQLKSASSQAQNQNLAGLGQAEYVKLLNLYYLEPNGVNQQLVQKMEGDLVTQFKAGGFKQNIGLFPGAALNQGASTQLNPSSIAEAMKSVVTIWVDKGFKVENGMGVPDRVIGSGFFIEYSGLIITNYHVIQSEVDPAYEGYSKLYIRPSDRPEDKIPATVVAWDRLFDLALLKTSIDPPQALVISGNDDLDVGTTVMALGSPGGLENTATTGIVSARGRRLLEMDSVMQVDSAINPGNSGGPLLGPDFSLAGVVFAGVEQFEGINFAIPTSLVRKVLPRFFWGGEVVHPWLGIQLVEQNKSLIISYVLPGSPADNLGIESGDRLKSINTKAVYTVEQAQREILGYFPGQIISLAWEQGSGQLSGPWEGPQEGSIALSKRGKEPLKAFTKAGFHKNILVPLFGFSVKNISQGILGIDFVVDEVINNSLADDSNISPGDSMRLVSFGTEEDRVSKNSIAYIQMSMQKRKSGFADSVMQLATYLSGNNYL